mgnify:CR=1 FL=1
MLAFACVDIGRSAILRTVFKEPRVVRPEETLTDAVRAGTTAGTAALTGSPAGGTSIAGVTAAFEVMFLLLFAAISLLPDRDP